MPSSDELLAFLEAPSSYPHEPDSVEIIQTHISYVALAGEKVYKVKKSVDLGFADFSSLERRKHFCEEEIRLNRRLCENVYEQVVPIGEQNGTLAFGASPAVEYAVEMRRMPDRHFLHNRLEKGQLDAADLERIADHLAAFYNERPRTPDAAEWGWAYRLRRNTDENLEQTADQAGDLIPKPAFDALRHYAMHAYDRYASLLAERRADGHFVDGHGDLRLEHVHLTEKSICIFDCIEFSERLRSVDVANDLAFLAMDLDAHGRSDLSRHLINAMRERLEDELPPALMNFYKCYRAYVRGKVEGLQSENEQIPEDERQTHRVRSQQRYQLALRYACARGEAMAIACMGRPATGKSTLAKTLGHSLGWPVASSDRIRKAQADMPLHERPDAERREALYSAEQTTSTYNELKQRALDVSESQGIVLDATYSQKERRDDLRQALKEAGIPYVFVELIAPDDMLRERLRQRDEKSTISDARLEDFEKLTARYETPSALEDANHIRVPARADVNTVASDVLKQLIARHW